jgi:hypothetical protein
LYAESRSNRNDKKMKRIRSWFGEHPWVCAAFLLGIGLGLLIALPILPFKLPDSSAQLISAFLGAAIAVTGAMWVTSHKERKFRSELRLAIHSVYISYKFALFERLDKLKASERQTQPLSSGDTEILESAKRMSEITKKSIEDLRPAFQSTPMDFIIYRQLIGAMDGIIRYFDVEAERQETRVKRVSQERQTEFNRPNLPKVKPSPFSQEELHEAVKNADSVIDTVGK